MFKLPKRDWIAQEIERAREHRKRQGHNLTPLQEGMVAAIAAVDPRQEPSSAKELDAIKNDLLNKGAWQAKEEWRISTCFDSEIQKAERDGTTWYDVSVSCDGQRLSCGCPTILEAYAYMRLYQKFIVEQFYSVGPPWADTGKYRS